MAQKVVGICNASSLIYHNILKDYLPVFLLPRDLPLFRLLPRTTLPLPLPLLVNLRRKWILEPKCNLIDHEHQRTQQQPGGFSKPQSGAQET